MSYAEDMAVLIEAITERRVVAAAYEGLPRLFCPHMIGGKGAEVKVFGLQFGGRSSGPLPQWRCFGLAGLSNVRIVEGWWRRGEVIAHGRQTCVDHYAYKVDDAHTAADFSDVPPLEP